MTTNLFPLLAFDAVLILAALDDIRRLHISNLFPLAMVAFFVVHVALTGLSPDLWQHLVSFAAVLVVGIFLFARGLIGGGDAKLLASTALWFNLQGLWILLPAVTIVGGFIALLLVMIRWMVPARATPGAKWAALRRRGPIPYAVPICVGGIMTAHLTGL